MSLALYRKYRSKSLDEIVGQPQVTEILSRALKQDRVAHAYLFTGPRGVGKTSIARILAHEINGLKYSDESTHLDIIEIDAASNNGVDDIRDLRDKVQLAPVSANKKVYIIDEVHMLSKPAFNALLKTLEEPPEHVVFILATTDVEKLPDTIISRTQRHTFRRASKEDLVKNLQTIAKKEKLKVGKDALLVIAEHSDGSFRDSVSLLDQLASAVGPDEEITADLVRQRLGLAGDEAISGLLAAIKSHDLKAATEALEGLENNGIQPKVIAGQLISAIRSRLETEPELLPLMDELIAVGGSSLPGAKLLTVIGQASYQPKKPASAALAANPPIPELAKKAEEPKPREITIKTAVKAEKPAPAPIEEAPAKKPVKNKTGKPAAAIDWPKLVQRVRKNSIALGSLLEKCTFDQDSSSVVIYARGEFYKKKLESQKYASLLHQALSEHAEVDWDVTIRPGLKPPKSSQAATVAAIMGGGEEVELSE